MSILKSTDGAIFGIPVSVVASRLIRFICPLVSRNGNFLIQRLSRCVHGTFASEFCETFGSTFLHCHYLYTITFVDCCNFLPRNHRWNCLLPDSMPSSSFSQRCVKSIDIDKLLSWVEPHRTFILDFSPGRCPIMLTRFLSHFTLGNLTGKE